MYTTEISSKTPTSSCQHSFWMPPLKEVFGLRAENSITGSAIYWMVGKKIRSMQAESLENTIVHIWSKWIYQCWDIFQQNSSQLYRCKVGHFHFTVHMNQINFLYQIYYYLFIRFTLIYPSANKLLSFRF